MHPHSRVPLHPHVSPNLADLLQAADEACLENDRAACVAAIKGIFDYFDDPPACAIAPLGQASHGRYMQI